VAVALLTVVNIVNIIMHLLHLYVGFASRKLWTNHESLKFGHLPLWKIIKIVATRCQILRLKCTKFNFGRGSAPDHTGGAYSAPPCPQAGLSGPTSKRRGR